MRWIIVFLLVTCVSIGSAKVFTKCSLAKYLRRLRVPESQLKDWVCMAKYESGFNTAALSPKNRDGSRDHGIFQINDYWNCDPQNGRPTKNGCKHPCSDYRNAYLYYDVQCIKQLYREHGRKFKFSYAWKKHCQNLSSNYLRGC